MLSLAETQNLMRDVVVAGDSPPAALGVLLDGGHKPERRLDIHHRNYEASLTRALLEKFPGTVWLVGSEFVRAGAGLFVRQFPPEAPCIAEYGSGFPQFLALMPGALRVPYLGEFSQLEWYVGYVSIATSEPRIDAGAFQVFDPDRMAGVSLCLQSGLGYFRSAWPVDRLLDIYVRQNAPDYLEFEPETVWLEIRGARGDFRINRLTEADFAFRRSVWEGEPLGAAAASARGLDPGFEPDAAFAALMNDGLVTGIISPDETGGSET